MKAQSVRLDGETIDKLKDLKIEMGGVNLKTYEDKINHLIWFYHNYKNNNGK
ncbi:MAG: hypothetical protein N4A38_03845 [Candidatus Gracilibacteria bacterium]|nr:hypothetical protein [Candidatus Gracilibacteria bacterium]